MSDERTIVNENAQKKVPLSAKLSKWAGIVLVSIFISPVAGLLFMLFSIMGKIGEVILQCLIVCAVSLYFIALPVAIVSGIVALAKISRHSDALTGKGYAKFGLGAGLVTCFFLGVALVIMVMFSNKRIEFERGDEAKQALEVLRTRCLALYMKDKNTLGCTWEELAKDSELPGPKADACRPTHYYWYKVENDGNSRAMLTATRCLSGGKDPNAKAINEIYFNCDFSHNDRCGVSDTRDNEFYR